MLANSWTDIERTLESSLVNSTHDEMIKLSSEMVTRHVAPPQNVRLVVFDSFKKVTSLVRAPPQALPAPKRIVIRAPESRPPSPKASQTIAPDSSAREVSVRSEDGLDLKEGGRLADEVKKKNVEEMPVESGVSSKDIGASDINVKMGAEVEIPTIAQMQNEVDPDAQKREKAAIIMQIAFKGFMEKKHRQAASSRKVSLISPFYAACLERVEDSSFPEMSRLYRLLFLGPLPHLLRCLDVARNDALSYKRTTKTRFSNADPKDYDAIDEEITHSA